MDWSWYDQGICNWKKRQVLKLVDTIYEITSVDWEKVTINITHKLPSHIFGDSVAPIIISNDVDVEDVMLNSYFQSFLKDFIEIEHIWQIILVLECNR